MPEILLIEKINRKLFFLLIFAEFHRKVIKIKRRNEKVFTYLKNTEEG